LLVAVKKPLAVNTCTAEVPANKPVLVVKNEPPDPVVIGVGLCAVVP
jgi:hypothetical protein